MGVPRGITPWYTLGVNTPRYRGAGFVPPWLGKTAEGFTPQINSMSCSCCNMGVGNKKY